MAASEGGRSRFCWRRGSRPLRRRDPRRSGRSRGRRPAPRRAPGFGRDDPRGSRSKPTATLETMPSVLFDAVVVPDGEEAAKRLAALGQALEFLKDQYRHCKPILMLGAGRKVVEARGVPRRQGGLGARRATSSPSSRRSAGIATGTARSIRQRCSGEATPVRSSRGGSARRVESNRRTTNWYDRNPTLLEITCYCDPRPPRDAVGFSPRLPGLRVCGFLAVSGPA